MSTLSITDRRWLMVGLAFLAPPHLVTLGLAVSGQTLGDLGIASVCPMLAATGKPCPLCGATTGWVALWRGHVAEGFGHNPFAAVMFFALAGMIGLGVVALARGWNPWPRLARVRWISAGLLTGLLSVASWAWTLSHS